jgi:hypothetical protein
MSSHYTFLLSFELDPVLALENAAVLQFVLNADSEQPATYPDHAFFQVFSPRDRFHRSYASFPTGAWHSAFWFWGAKGAPEQPGVNLNLPGQKLEGVFQNLLPLASWLVSLASSDSCVGLVKQDDSVATDRPIILYAKNRRLYLGESSAHGASCYDDGSQYRDEA